MIALFIVAIFLCVLAFGIHNLKWHFLISGYNTLSPEDQQKVDINGLSKTTAVILYVVAACIAGLGIATWQEIDWLVPTIILLLVAFSIGASIYSRRYSKNVSNSKRKNKIASIILVVTFVGVAVLLYFSTQETSVTTTDDALTIEGMYGDTFSWDELDDVQLVNELPAISIRTNGSAVGSDLKGHFKFENGDKAILFVDKSVPPFITFTANDKLYYVNFKNVDDTNALYDTMEMHIK